MTFDNLLLVMLRKYFGNDNTFREKKQLRNVLYFLVSAVSANCDNDGNYLNGELDLLSTKLIVYKQKGEMKIITKRRKLHVRAFKQ